MHACGNDGVAVIDEGSRDDKDIETLGWNSVLIFLKSQISAFLHTAINNGFPNAYFLQSDSSSTSYYTTTSRFNL